MMSEPKIVVVGSLNMDIVVEAKRVPHMGETIMGEKVHFIPGGKGANQAVAAARLGAQTTMIGTVGQDDFGKTLLSALESSGIQKDTVKVTSEVTTGIASILLAEGDNQIIVISGANGHCTPEDVYKHEEAIAGADILLMQLEISLETVTVAAKLAKKYGKKVILNPAPARELPTDLLQNVDYITPNRSELALLTGMAIEEGHLEKSMEALLSKGPKHIITTLGSEGATYMKKGSKPVVIPSYKIQVVDTTGAGDAFNAGFAYGVAQGKSVLDAVGFASKVAALAVTKLGAQAGMPTIDEVNSYPFQGR